MSVLAVPVRITEDKSTPMVARAVERSQRRADPMAVFTSVTGSLMSRDVDLTVVRVVTF